MLRQGFIYTLSDDTGVRYIGQTYNIKRRYNSHCSILQNNTESYKHRWIRKILNKGKKPIINVILKTQDLDNEEIRLIAEYKNKGFQLVNASMGGKDISYISKIKELTPWKGTHTPLQRIVLNYRQTMKLFKKLERNDKVLKIQRYLEYVKNLVKILGKDEINRRLWIKYEN